MNRLLLTKLTALTILCSLSTLKAETLQYEKALEWVWDHNPALVRARESLQATESRLKSAQGQYLPEVNAQITHSKSEVTRPSDVGQGVEDSSSARLELSQNLFAGLATKAAVESAKADRSINQSEVQLIYAQVGSEFIKAYSQVYYAIKTQQLTGEILERRRNNFELVKLRFEAGNENRGSLLVAQASLDEAIFDQDKSNFDLSVARQRLKGVMAQQEADLLNVSAVPSTIVEDELKKLGPEEIEAIKVADHPALLAEVARIEKSQAALTSARAQFFPKLGLSAGLNRNDQYFFPDQNESWSVGLTLTIPLYKGGQDIHNYRAVDAELRRARAQKEQITFDQKSSITAAGFSLKSSDQRVRVAKSSMDAAQVRTEIARQKYNNGLLSFEDWSNIEDDYALRQKSYLEAQSALLAAQADWMLAMGKNPFEKLTTYNKALP